MLPKSLPKLSRSLSDANDSYQRAIVYEPQCNEGDTVIMNYFKGINGHVTATYLKKIDGQMVFHRVEGDVSVIPRNWTYDSCIIPFHSIFE